MFRERTEFLLENGNTTKGAKVPAAGFNSTKLWNMRISSKNNFLLRAKEFYCCIAFFVLRFHAANYFFVLFIPAYEAEHSFIKDI